MRICMILEGCYPYVRGGVSGWMHGIISAMKEHEFVLWTIAEKREMKGAFLYELPENVKEVREVFLSDAITASSEGTAVIRFTPEERAELRKLITCESPDWPVIFRICNKCGLSAVDFLMSREFLDMLLELSRERFPHVSFTEYFFTMRSILLPLLFLIGQEPPQADIYHSAATGYGGLLGVLGSWKTGSPFIVTEHGIYTREREEEILRAIWVPPYCKDHWISMFHMLSRCAYDRAVRVTSLFPHSAEIQEEIGCPRYKTLVISNGIKVETFADIPVKEDDGFIDIGAIVRLAAIKDIKTMIYAFFELKQRIDHVRLHILGDTDDAEYARECHALVSQLGVEDIYFKGNTYVPDYLKKLDFTILTSISEGQPLAVLESMAARRPTVTTDVGCCRDLIEGSYNDSFGSAGICVPPMHPGMLADACEFLCRNKQTRLKMGEAGRSRVMKYYLHKDMIDKYNKNYEEVLKLWRESAFS